MVHAEPLEGATRISSRTPRYERSPVLVATKNSPVLRAQPRWRCAFARRRSAPPRRLCGSRHARAAAPARGPRRAWARAPVLRRRRSRGTIRARWSRKVHVRSSARHYAACAAFACRAVPHGGPRGDRDLAQSQGRRSGLCARPTRRVQRERQDDRRRRLRGARLRRSRWGPTVLGAVGAGSSGPSRLRSADRPPPSARSSRSPARHAGRARVRTRHRDRTASDRWRDSRRQRRRPVFRASGRRSGLRLVAQMLCDSAGVADEDRYGRADRFQRHEPEPLMAGGHHQHAGSSQVCLEQLLVSGVVPDQDVESVIGQLDQLVSQCSGFGRRRASHHERRRAPVVEWSVVERPERRAARSSPLR